jgi:hypothetical protein
MADNGIVPTQGGRKMQDPPYRAPAATFRAISLT